MTTVMDMPDPPEGDDLVTPEEAAELYALATNLQPVPSFARIGWLKRNAQALGGRLVSGVCRPRGISYPTEDGLRTVMVNTCGCGNDTLADMPYERAGGETDFVRVCLVCDGGPGWPRLDGDGLHTEPPPEGGAPPPSYWASS